MRASEFWPRLAGMERIATKSKQPAAKQLPASPATGSLQLLANQSAFVTDLRALQARADSGRQRSRTPVQRYADLYSLYGEDFGDFEGKTEWLRRFHAAQQALNVESNMTDSLERLSEDMIANSRPLQEALDLAMQEHWGAQDHALTGFVPARAFVQLIQDGKLFRDYVGQRHGVHSHQLQWYTLMRVLGAEEAHALYREAGNPRWFLEGENKYMWDKIVDGTKTGDKDRVVKPTDFTVPENVESFVLERFSENGERPAEKAVSEAHEGQPEAAEDYTWRHPTLSAYTPPMQAAARVFTSPDSPRDEKARAVNSIVNDRLTNTTGWYLLGTRKTIEWSGWRPTDMSDPERPFEPTIARHLS